LKGAILMINKTETYLDIFEREKCEIWMDFINKNEITKKLLPKEFYIEMQNERSEILEKLKYGTLSCRVYADESKSTYSNYFVVNDIRYGGICNKCNTDGIVLLINDENYKSHLYDKKIFIPGLETYFTRKINPKSEIFRRIFPVPVNPDTDYWYCPNCNELHRFKYDSIFGLLFNQEVIKFDI
jgi:hypothetical protein